MTRLTPLVLAFALLGCRDTSELEVDALQAEIGELTSRLEALEVAAATDDTVLADVQSNADATAAELASIQAEVDALATVDLTDTLAAIDAVDDRVEALEDAGLATETWVEGQVYMTQAAGETLDIRITANADAAQSNGESIGDNASSLSTQLTSILANVSAISANAQSLTDVDARMTVTEAGTAQAGTDVARIDAALLTLSGEVSELDDGVDALDDSVDGLSDRIDSAEATVGDSASELAALASADSGLQAAIDELGAQASDLAGDITANRSSIETNTEVLTQAGGERSALAQDISINTELIAGVEGDVSFNAEVIESNLTDIGANTRQTLDNTAGVELAMDTVSELETQLEDSIGELDDVLRRLDLVEVYTDTQWVTANTATGSDSGAIGPMQMTFTKELEDSILYVTYSDNLRTTGGNKACRWEVYFNGQPCSSPGRVAGDIYQQNGNSHEQTGIHGYCRGNSGGDFGARDVAVSVRVSNSPGYSGSDCYTGWRGDQLGVLRVTEAVDQG